MIKKLLKRPFATLITICLAMGSFTISAQNSVVFTATLPSTSIGTGSTQVVNLEYVSDVVGKCKVALERRTSTGGYISDGEIVAAYFDTSITTTPIAETKSLTVPANTILSSALTNGEKYMWTLTEMTSTYGFLSESKNDVEVIAGTAVTNSLDWTTIPGVTIATGTTETINLHYTADILGKGKAALVRTTSNGGYISNAEIAVAYFDTEPTSTTPVEKSFALTIPADTPLSSALENGEKYMWNITQMTTSYGFISQKQLDVEVIEETAVTNSLDWTTTPVATITTGATETINLHYTADILGKGKAALVRTTSNGDYISNAEIAVAYFDTEPTSTTPVEKSFVLTIPADTPLSSALANGEKYMWNITQMTTSYGFISQKQLDVEVTEGNIVTNTLDWTTTPVATITTGATETINLHYTADVLGKGKAALVRTTSTGGYISGAEIAVEYFDTDPTTTTPVEKSFVLTIPSETPLSDALENGEKYMWNITQMTTSYGFISQKQLDVIVTNHLKVSDFNKDQASKLITKNPVNNTLTLNSTVEFSSVSIYDISGKKVAKGSKEKTTDGLDVSNLQNGIYFIVTDTNLKAKFIKE